MTEAIKNINIDVQKKRAGEAVAAKQGDAKSRFLRVTVCSGGTKITVAQDAEAVINASRPDGASKSFFCTVNGDGTVTAPLTGWMLECAGVLKCSISVLGGDGERLTSTTFFVDVEPAEVTDGDIENDERVDVLAELVVECREAAGAAGAAASAANNAASAANEAAGAALSAVGTANDAAASANEAASYANSAAEAARAVADSKLDKSAVVQETGEGVDVVMSQGAVTEAIAASRAPGVNLVLDSDVEYTNANYMTHIYALTEEIQLGETYTVTIWGKLGEGKKCFSAFISSDSDPLGTLELIADGVYKVTGKINAWKTGGGIIRNLLRIYALEQSTPAASTITKIKMEHGAVANPVWTPAPEDIVTSWSGAGFHNSIFRGKMLGTSVTEAQYAAISSGTFDDLYIGDYWTINNVNWLIAGFDYLYNTGDKALTKHHAVIIPETCLYNATMNDTDTTEGGYALSQMRTQNLESAKETINAAFSGHILTYRGLLTNAVTDGHPSGRIWTDCSVELMTEVMCYGAHFYSASANNGVTTPTMYTTYRTQLPIFRMAPDLISVRNQNVWLQDVCSPTIYGNADNTGAAYCYIASRPYGVRPFFLIGA